MVRHIHSKDLNAIEIALRLGQMGQIHDGLIAIKRSAMSSVRETPPITRVALGFEISLELLTGSNNIGR